MNSDSQVITETKEPAAQFYTQQVNKSMIGYATNTPVIKISLNIDILLMA